MIKGIRKNTVFVRLPRDKYFECAYFIIRADGEGKYKTEEMVRAANRIIECSELPELKKASRRGRWRQAPWEAFAFGAILGMGVTAAAWLLTLIV